MFNFLLCCILTFVQQRESVSSWSLMRFFALSSIMLFVLTWQRDDPTVFLCELSRQRTLFFFDIWRGTWWEWTVSVSRVWHFDPAHWSHLAALWSVCMLVRPYVCTDILSQIHARKHKDSCLAPSHEHMLEHKHPHEHVITWWAAECTDCGVVIIAFLGLCLWGHLDGTRSISGQMLWAKRTLSSRLWNTCVQCDNDTRTHFAHTWRRDTGREEMYRWTVCIWVTPASLTGCTIANGCTFGIHLRQALTSVMWLVGYLLNYMLPFSSGCYQRGFYALKRPKLKSYDTIYVFFKRWPNNTSQSFQSKASKLITFEPPADYQAPRHPVGLIGKKEGGCVGIREQKDPSLSSKRVCSQLIPCSVATAFYFSGRRGVTAAGREEGGLTIAGEFDGRGCRFQSNL